MLETIHEFTRREFDASADAAEIRDRHTAAFVDLLETAQPHLDGAGAAEWTAILATDNPNIQAALAHAVSTGDADAAQRIVAAAWRFWRARGHLDEGTNAATAALALEGSTDQVRARALDAAGSIAYWCGDRPTTRRYYEDAVATYRALDDPQGLAGALYNLSFPVVDEDGLDVGTAMLEEAITMAEAAGDRVIVGGAHAALGRALFLTSPEIARDHAQKAIVETEALGNLAGTGWAYLVLGSASNLLGDNPAAVESFQHALRIFVDLNDLSGTAAQLGAMSVIAHQVGEEVTALYFAGAVTHLWDETGLAGVTHLDSVLKEFITPEALASRPPDVLESFEAGRTADLGAVIDASLVWSVPSSPDPKT
jgi:tetratricopeptide (TPR) repeat protein